MREYDLVVVGGGSGNMIFGPELDGWRSAIVEADRFGGTCLNRGCVPSKMYVVAADVATAVHEAAHHEISARFDGVDWPALRDRIFGRLDPTHDRAVHFRERSGVDVLTTTARFVAPHVLDVGGEQITAERIVVAVGARPSVPPIPGLDGVAFHTSDTIMRLDELPRSMVIIGGGAIAAEMGHVFAAFGTEVTIVQLRARLLMAEDEDISVRFTELVSHRMHVATDAMVTRVSAAADGASVTWRDASGLEHERTAEVLLVATGRVPNTDRLDAAAAGLELDEHGHLVVDRYCRTSVEGVWALGDVHAHSQLKHLANAEARIVRHNLTHPDDLRARGDLAPHAVFSHPQVAAVGLTEAEARASGRPIAVASQPYSATAYGWALEDTTSFAKVIVDAADRSVLGAHIIGPDAALLLQPLLQAMMLGQTADQLAHDVLYIHPALTEVVEQVLLEL